MGKAARDLLAQRGITQAVIRNAKELLTRLESVAPAQEEAEDREAQLAETEQAEAALWGWYLEWSQIARAAIKQPALLRQLGFGVGRTRDPSVSEDDEEAEAGVGDTRSDDSSASPLRA